VSSRLLCGIFFLSGAAALVFEALWFHQTGLTFGNSVWASSLVLAGFMAGLALGSAGAARWGARLRSPLLAYALLEVAVAIAGVGLVWGLPWLAPGLAASLSPLAEFPLAQNATRLLIAFALLLIPSTAMGATLPLLADVLTAHDESFGRVLGRLYGWNTLGAVAGVLIAETHLIPLLGIRASSVVAACLNGCVAAVALWLARRTASVSLPTARPSVDWQLGTRWLIAAFLSGACLLALEVIWFRYLSLFTLGEALSFAVMLAAVLAGIAFGGLAGGAVARRLPGAQRFTALVAMLSGGLCVASYSAAPWLLGEPSAALETGVRAVALLAAPLVLPVSFLSGALFTFIGTGLRAAADTASATAGSLTVANTLGASLGALLGGFVLLPALGIEGGLFAIALAYGGLGALLYFDSREARRPALAAAALLAIAAASFPFGSISRQVEAAASRYLQPGGRIVAVREGPLQTILYLEQRGLLEKTLHHRMVTDGFSMSGTGDVARRYMKLYVYWPLAVRPDTESALLISFGVGSTAKALTDSKQLRSIDVVDISRDVLEMSDIPYPDPREHPLRDSRVRVHVEDGRYFLQSTRRRFDLITAEPPPPRMSGVANLYTREYFELLKRRLTPEGIATYWLPIHSLSDRSSDAILKAFCDVFDDCSLWHGTGRNLMMVGSRSGIPRVEEASFAAQWNDPRVAPELAALALAQPEHLLGQFIADAETLGSWLRDTQALDDDHPRRVALAADPLRSSPLYRTWAEASSARERFVESRWITEHWPASLREAALPYFDVEATISRWADGQWRGRGVPGPALQQLLADEVEVGAAVHWLLRSSARQQEILRSATPSQQRHPYLRYFAAVDALARRDWDTAALGFEAALGDARVGSIAHQLRALALCFAGRLDEAAELAQLADGSPDTFWAWLADEYGLRRRLAAQGL
jgi:predicted membrane-bound spermidine synthase